METANCTGHAPSWGFSSEVSITTTEPRIEEDHLGSMCPAMFLYVFPTVCVLGVCANVLVLVVWSAESSFNTNTFCMKCLAVADTLFLIVKIPLCVKGRSDISTLEKTWLLIMHDYCRILSVHTTLAVVFVRWLVVYKPLIVHRLLTKRRTVAGYMCLLLWIIVVNLPCALMYTGTFPDISSIHDVGNVNFAVTLHFSTRGVSLAVPITVLVMLNISIACIICRHKGDSNLGQQSGAARSSRCQRLVAAVVCISVTTSLSYPLAFIGDILGAFYRNELRQFCDDNCFLVIFRLADLMEVLNSSVNIIIYLLFVTHFRHLCLYCFRRCFHCLTVSQWISRTQT